MTVTCLPMIAEPVHCHHYLFMLLVLIISLLVWILYKIYGFSANHTLEHLVAWSSVQLSMIQKSVYDHHRCQQVDFLGNWQQLPHLYIFYIYIYIYIFFIYIYNIYIFFCIVKMCLLQLIAVWFYSWCDISFATDTELCSLSNLAPTKVNLT